MSGNQQKSSKHTAADDHVYVSEGLTYADIPRGIEILSEYAKKFKPDFIFGINRGGAIVGGLLAKKLNKSYITLLSVVKGHGKTHVTEQRHDAAAPLYGKILLVDDMGKTGDHMNLAYQHLCDNYPSVKISRVVMLRMETHAQGPEPEHERRPQFEKYAFLTHNSRVLLPWDSPLS